MIDKKIKTWVYGIWACCMLNSVELVGQSKMKLHFSTLSGYEHNVFNANRNTVVVLDDGVDLALRSGYYQKVKFYHVLSFKKNNHDLNVSSTLQHDYFPILSEASLFRPSIKARYSLTLKKKHKLSLSSRFNRYITNRPEDQEEVINPPRAYHRRQYWLRYQVKYKPRSSFYIEGNIRNNKYLTEEDRTFWYESTGISTGVSHRMKKGKKQSQFLESKLSFNRREYTDIQFDFESDKEVEKLREWSYLLFNSYYTLERKKLYKLSIGMQFIQRNDIIQNRFGYNQYQFLLRYDCNYKKVMISFKGSLAHRQYHSIKARKGEDNLLIHNYIRSNIGFTYKVENNIDIVANLNWISRQRNFSNGAVSFLSYNNANINFGIKYKIR